MDDKKIIDLYWARSELAIRETDAKYGNYCTKIALNILKNIEDARECVNDTYMQAWNLIPPERPNLLSSYLAKITRNLSINLYRKDRTKKRGGGEIPLILDELYGCIPSRNSVQESLEFRITVRIINDFLYEESKESRIVFVRRYFYADPIKSIAERFTISESKVKSMLFRTRNKLKIYLENEGVII